MKEVKETLFDLIGDFLSGIEGLPDLRNVLDESVLGSLNLALSYLVLVEHRLEERGEGSNEH